MAAPFSNPWSQRSPSLPCWAVTHRLPRRTRDQGSAQQQRAPLQAQPAGEADELRRALVCPPPRLYVSVFGRR